MLFLLTEAFGAAGLEHLELFTTFLKSPVFDISCVDVAVSVLHHSWHILPV